MVSIILIKYKKSFWNRSISTGAVEYADYTSSEAPTLHN